MDMYQMCRHIKTNGLPCEFTAFRGRLKPSAQPAPAPTGYSLAPFFLSPGSCRDESMA